MNKAILNINDVVLEDRPKALAAPGEAAQRFDARMGFVSRLLGAQKLGYNITALPPGKRAFPAHNHRVNEEMFFVLKGEGEVRIGTAIFPIGEGDFIACPAGGVETAHQIINTGDAELRFLAVSTQLSPEICDYPDSAKFGVYANWAGTADHEPEVFRYVGRESESKDYWDGE